MGIFKIHLKMIYHTYWFTWETHFIITELQFCVFKFLSNFVPHICVDTDGWNHTRPVLCVRVCDVTEIPLKKLP